MDFVMSTDMISYLGLIIVVSFFGFPLLGVKYGLDSKPIHILKWLVIVMILVYIGLIAYHFLT